MLHTQTRCRSVDVRGVTAGQKTAENQDWAAGRRAVVGRGPPWAAGRRAAGPWWAVGRGPPFSKTRF